MGFFDFLKKKEPPVQEEQAVPVVEKKIYEFDGQMVPKMVDGIPLAYKYFFVPINNFDKSVYQEIIEDGNFGLEVLIEGEQLKLVWNESVLGFVNAQKYVQMAIDFERRREQIKAYAQYEGKAVLAFYKDKKKGLQNRETTETKLTSYKSNSKQEEIFFLTDIDELSIDEESGVVETEDFEAIGKVPAKILNKIKKEGYKACFFDHKELEDSEADEAVYIPYIKVYW